MKRIKITIEERGDLWWLTRHDLKEADLEVVGWSPTAAEMLAAVQKIGQDTAPSILIVEWYPTTRIGRAVVKALTSTTHKRGGR